ncbi:LOW QUALITY PROTEIN: flavin-containing monooxygenase 5-like [Malurus melanocephalus]|uniref:LOW QUALITY PROTEIN: flavin-containing monooxygenase 5-like n=1 Tax=Malurus melanocephalus TaxID=175006 RepID=UPI0025487E42|nr:LOW QUALITY PROTEIN: flavin-containing monooxygenase 5-like [Malurus melanocephalus]
MPSTGDVGNKMPAATGAARAVCHPGYQQNRSWADPDNPRVKSPGQCLFTKHAATRIGCVSVSPRSAWDDSLDRGDSAAGTAKPAAGSQPSSGFLFPARGRSDGGGGPAPDAAYRGARPRSGLAGRGPPAESLARLRACRQPSLGCSSPGRRSVKVFPALPPRSRGPVVQYSMAKKVAIIGGGSSGLCAIKACLQEGLEPVCFERTGDIGGLWRFEENPEDGRASIYRSVIINTSKEMMCFSDYPIPEDFPNYMHNSKIMEYFRMYAQHFDLLRHIRFRTSVCRVSKRPDFASSGQWEVVTESEGKQEMAVFDAVLVCSGHHTDAHLPLSSFPGLEKFEGWYLHSRDYKNPQSFLGKRVVVVGIGNSGIDIAVELSNVAKQVFLSTKRGSWVLHRVADSGYPFDFTYISRFKQLLQNLLPPNVVNFFLERKLNARFDHTLYGLKPKHR